MRGLCAAALILCGGRAAGAAAGMPGHGTATPAAMEGLRMPAPAAQDATATPADAPSTYDRIWSFTELYRNDDSRAVQRIRLSGRFQHDYALVDADQGNHDEWNVRRLRLGGQVTFLRDFTFHGEAELNPQERDPLYVRLTDFSVEWSRRPSFVLTVGKQGVPFTSEGATSSRELITMDRSNLANNIWFPQEYMTGVSVSGEAAAWVYQVGVYSAGAANREFGEFSGGIFTLGLLGYDFAEALGFDEALVTGNYVYQQEDPANTFTRELAHVLSVHTRFDDNAWGARTDLALAAGYLGQSDLWSVMVTPFYDVTPKLQLVARYTLVTSDDSNGVRLATYENRVVPTGRGDRFREFYAGANYYLYGHRLKLQTGVQWGEMRDRAADGGAYAGVAWTSGLRIGW
jgi:phosphate-selective porin OprO/OprP